MRAIAVLVLIMTATPAAAGTVTCRGFCFGICNLTCETRDPPAVRAASFCDVMNRQGGAFEWSRNDTNGTKDRADLINAAGKRLCGWKGKK